MLSDLVSEEIKRFNPVAAAEEIKRSYKDYITTTFDMADQEYAKLFRQALEEAGMIAKGPYLDIGGAYETGNSLRQMIDQGKASPLFEELEPVPEKERELKLDRPMYLHQEQALEKASAGQNLVVTTGTGSGKTESFLLPILESMLREIEQGKLDSGVRAMIIYPMNALSNDQIKRMRVMLKNYPRIRFGIYNGNTLHDHAEALREYRKTHKDENGMPLNPLPNELISREEMQKDPPHILITNYSMLEYMMLRPKDDAVFSGAKLRYIVLDEAHIYKGATGMETSMLMRRLRARISKPNAVQYILTSATLGGKDADDEIVSFANKLTGVGFNRSGIIRSVEKHPTMKEERDVDPKMFSELCDCPDQVSDILKKYGLNYYPEGTPEEQLYHMLLHLKLFSVLRAQHGKPITVQQLQQVLQQIDSSITARQVTDFVSVCGRAEYDGANLIKPRYHFFTRALEGAYITLGNPKKLFLTRQNHVAVPDGYEIAVFEAAICTDCGRLAIVGETVDGHLVQTSKRGSEDRAEYYLLKQSSDGELFEDDEFLTEEEDDGSHDYTVCPVCGAICTEADLKYTDPCAHNKDGFIKVRLVDRSKSGQTKCPACGVGSFRRFYLGSEAATAVLGTELFEQLPREEQKEIVVEAGKGGLFARNTAKRILKKEKTRQYLCFSDSRSEAAYFATYMERSYQEILRRRGIWQTVQALKTRGIKRISVTDFVNELARTFEENRSFAEWDKGNAGMTSISRQNAWIAVLNEMFNARRSTSLVSIGALAFCYRPNQGLDEIIQEAYPNVSLEDAGALLEQLVQDGVFSGALNAGKEISLTEAEREYIFFSPAEKKLVKVKTAEDSKRTHLTGWCGRARTNGKGGYYPSAKMARLTRALNITPEQADELLGSYWDSVFRPEKDRFSLDANDFDVLLGGTDAVKFYRCRKCGKVTPFNVKGVCASVKCDGKLEEIDPMAEMADNHYARLYRSKQMQPLQIKEHTAQLAKDQQTRYQEGFVNKQINVLSCSTTFEMGVDVGSLETVYLRDVPPSPSNYVQRAGRAGRGKDSAAFVLTYAKLSSHDFTYYENPEQMISGKISAPVFEVENEKILYRHVFAVAISEFLAENPDVYDGDNQNILLNEGGYERLQEYLAHRPENLKQLLEDSIPKSMHQRLGITDWSWVNHLCGKTGLLQLAVDDFRGTVEELEQNQRAAHRSHDDEMAGKWQRALRNFRCGKDDNAGKKSLISFLVRNNILPKYGFPVDTVELLPNASTRGSDKDLQLARDLQMAIADYAPGAQVVADGKLYTSRYIRKSPGKNGAKDWETGYFCPKCPTCQQPNFTKEPIGKSRECISCHNPIPKLRWNSTLEPRLGFCASPHTDTVPMHRPEHDYKTDDVYIGDPQRNLLLEQEFIINGKQLKVASTSNDSLVVVGQTPFKVCPVCGYADPVDVPLEHRNMYDHPCQNKDGTSMEYRLSHDFKTDVARLTFVTEEAGDMNTMLSVLYALLEGLSREMGIERTDIKGCLFRTFEDGLLLYSVVLYDAVAGGAGHVRRVVTEDGEALQRVLKRSFMVANDCSCGSSCYKCLRNYYNQKIHDQLDRKKAADFLGNWIGDMEHSGISQKDTERKQKETWERTKEECIVKLGRDFGVNMRDSGWNAIWRTLLIDLEDETDRQAVRELLKQTELFEKKEKPYFDCEFTLGNEQCTCDLLWPESKVILFTLDNEESYDKAQDSGWKCFSTGDSEFSAQKLTESLKEEK